MSTFAKQIAVVTGASGGIGGEIATALARLGATVYLVGRDSGKLDTVAKRVAGGCVTCVMDLTIDQEVERFAQQITKDVDRLDVLVHSAGAISHGTLEQAPIETLDLLYRTNVRGPLLLTQKLLPHLRKPRGQIVFINSSTGLAARANTGQFSATQHAFKALADTLRDEVNADQVRVLSVFPGRTATARVAALHQREGRPYEPELLLQPADVASAVICALELPWSAELTNISIRPMRKSY